MCKKATNVPHEFPVLKVECVGMTSESSEELIDHLR